MNLIKLNIVGYSHSEFQQGAFALILSEENGKRNLSIVIGACEAQSIAIGLENIKQQVFDVLCYYLQGLDDSADDMLHTVIDGPPGVGKTEMAKILADLYQKMGKIPTNQFVSVKRSDLIGGFLGQTAMKTQ